MSERLFVYGTLMRGELAHGMLARFEAVFLGAARTPPRYALFEAEGGAYPALADGGARAIEGELYAIDAAAFPSLDEYEDAPELYERRKETFEGHGEAWVYVMRPKYLVGLPEWPEARWSGASV